MWFFIGVASASFVGAMLTDMFGFRNGQWISVVVIAAAALAWFFFLPETRIDEVTTKDTVKETDKSAMMKLPWKVIAATSFTVFIARFLAWGVLAATAILWLSDLFGDGVQIANLFIPIATLTGLYTALSNLTSVGSTPLTGSVSDRFGRRWPVIGLAMVLGGLGLWLMSGQIHSLALIGAFLVPLAGSSAETLVPAIAGDRVPKKLRSRALGLINTAGDLGATIGPFVALGVLNLGWLSLDGIYRIGGVFFGVIAMLALSPWVARQSRTTVNAERIS
jgi:MFS family permease